MRWIVRVSSFLVLFAVTVEVGARFFVPDAYYVWPPGYETTFQPDPNLLTGIAGPSRIRINSFGVRAGPFTDSQRYRLLAVGGSTTICTYLDDSEAWPQRVQELLNRELGPDHVWVGNVGRSGHTTVQHVLQVEKLLPQHPEIDAVILLIGINDLLRYLGSRWRTPGLLAALGGFRPERASPTDHLKRAFSVFPPWDTDLPWYLRTGVGVLYTTSSWRNPEWEQARVHPDGRNVAEWRRNRRQASTLLESMPDLTPALDGYEKHVNALVDRAEANGVRVLLLTQPTLWKSEQSPEEIELLWMGGPPLNQLGTRAPYYAPAALAEGMRRYNERLLEVCAKRGVECLDVAERLPRDASVFYDDAHFNEAGARQLAELVAAHLLETPPLVR